LHQEFPLLIVALHFYQSVVHNESEFAGLQARQDYQVINLGEADVEMAKGNNMQKF